MYYSGNHIDKIKTSILITENEPKLINIDYYLKKEDSDDYDTFTLTYYPHTLDKFTALLKHVFGKHCRHQIMYDFNVEKTENPGFIQHLIYKD